MFDHTLQLLTEKQSTDAIGGTRITFELGDRLEGFDVQQQLASDKKSSGGRNEAGSWNVYTMDGPRLKVGNAYAHTDNSGTKWVLTIKDSQEVAGRGMFKYVCEAVLAKG